MFSKDEKYYEKLENNLSQKTNNKIGKRSIKTIIIVIALLLLIYIFIGLIAKEQPYKLFKDLFKDEEGEIGEVITETELKDVLEICELSTYRYYYNAVARIYKDDNKEKIACYVSYKGSVTAGINLNEVKFDINNESKKIVILLPEVEILDATVVSGSEEYIYKDKKYNKADKYFDIYECCEEDLKERCENNAEIKKRAYENAVESFKALYKPWLEDLEEYELEIK